MQPMPAEMSDRADTLNRYLGFLVDALMLGLIAALSHKTSLDAKRIGLHLNNWKYDALTGLIAGTLLVASQRLMLGLTHIDPQHAFTSRVRKGTALIWIAIFVTGAFSEELWIAVCLVLFKATGHSVASSVAMTMVVFAAIHYPYGFWGTVAVATKGTFSALLFLHYGSLVVTFLFHFVENMGSLYWSRYWRR
jgi:membrane protease YdiL (CAAX protease family)